MQRKQLRGIQIAVSAKSVSELGNLSQATLVCFHSSSSKPGFNGVFIQGESWVHRL